MTVAFVPFWAGSLATEAGPNWDGLPVSPESSAAADPTKSAAATSAPATPRAIAPREGEDNMGPRSRSAQKCFVLVKSG
jgi:hypothetical protein